jgi:hypothetical protein
VNEVITVWTCPSVELCFRLEKIQIYEVAGLHDWSSIAKCDTYLTASSLLAPDQLDDWSGNETNDHREGHQPTKGKSPSGVYVVIVRQRCVSHPGEDHDKEDPWNEIDEH